LAKKLKHSNLFQTGIFIGNECVGAEEERFFVDTKPNKRVAADVATPSPSSSFVQGSFSTISNKSKRIAKWFFLHQKFRFSDLYISESADGSAKGSSRSETSNRRIRQSLMQAQNQKINSALAKNPKEPSLKDFLKSLQ
jgi:hypothetical protein